jgi:hypothetical protein
VATCRSPRVTPVNSDYRIEESKLTAVLEKVTVQIR